MNKEILQKYADLVVRTGVNLQKKQQLLITSPIECAEFARMVAEKAYEAGAINVIVEYTDEKLSLIRYNKASRESFKKEPKYMALAREQLVKEKTAFIIISASDPDLLSEVDSDKIAALSTTINKTLKEYYSGLMNNEFQWCVV